MLSPPNNAVVARDPALPGLALLLDPVALATALSTTRATLRHLRYKPGTSCTVAVTDADGRWHRLRALTAARFGEKGLGREEAFGAALIEATTPAQDRDVPGLRWFSPEDRRAKALADLFGEHRLSTARLDPLSYRLGRRLVARLSHGGGDALLKLHAPARHAQALTGAMAASAAGHAPLLAACSKRLAVVSAWVPGRTLAAADGPLGFDAAGEALARLHQLPVPPPFVRSRAAEVATLRATLSDVARLAPWLAEDIQDLSHRLSAALSGAAAQPGPIHGDFSADQIVIGDHGALVIDWDRAGHGDQAADLGSALARLDADRMFDDLSVSAAEAAADALLAGYVDRRPLPPAWQVQRAAHLAALLGEPFRRQLDEWPDRMSAAVAETRKRLDRLSLDGPCDVALPQLATLCSVGGAAPVLAASGCGTLASPPRLMRHKPGRRAMVACVTEGVDGRATWLAKTRSKRPDHATPALHRALRAKGFDGHAPSAFAVPEMREGPEGFRTVLLEHVPGVPLSDWQVPRSDLTPFTAAGRALAALHGTEIEIARAWSHADEVDVADTALTQAASRHPDAAESLHALRDWLHRQPPSVSPPVLLHRDFYPDQVLIDGERLWLIDLDLAAHGDRHVDLGNMLAHLTEYGLRTRDDVDALARQRQAFLQGYRQAGGTFAENEVTRLHDISLLRHLAICDRIEARAHVFRPLLNDLVARVRDGGRTTSADRQPMTTA